VFVRDYLRLLIRDTPRAGQAIASATGSTSCMSESIGWRHTVDGLVAFREPKLITNRAPIQQHREGAEA